MLDLDEWADRRPIRTANTLVRWNRVFSCVLAVSAFGISHFFDHVLVLSRARDFSNNSAVFLDAFYRSLLPMYLEILLVALPAWGGMTQGPRLNDFTRMTRAAVLIGALAALCTLVSSNLYWWQIRVWYVRPLHQPRLPSLMSLAVACPATYLLLTVIERRRHTRS